MWCVCGRWQISKSCCSRGKWKHRIKPLRKPKSLGVNGNIASKCGWTGAFFKLNSIGTCQGSTGSSINFPGALLAHTVGIVWHVNNNNGIVLDLLDFFVGVSDWWHCCECHSRCGKVREVWQCFVGCGWCFGAREPGFLLCFQHFRKL